MAQTPRSGRYASIRISTGTTAGLIDLLGHWEISMDLDQIDASKFGTVWKVPVPGMQGWSGTIEGFYEAATSSGNFNQNYLQYCMVNATKIQDVRFYIDSSNNSSSWQTFIIPNMSTKLAGYSTNAGAYITGSRITQDKGGLASMSLDLLGHGPLCCVLTSEAAASSDDWVKVW